MLQTAETNGVGQTMKLNDILAIRLGSVSLGRLFGLCLVITVGGVIGSYVWPEKTNGRYLQELIQGGYIQKMAIAYVATIKEANTATTPTATEWVQIEKDLSECVAKQANDFLVSGDPSLRLKADKATPSALAKRFLDACDGTGSVASAKSMYSGLEVAPIQNALKLISDASKKSSKQEDRFLEFLGEVNTTTFDLSTVQILQPRRFSIVSTTIGFPWMMTFELNAFDTLRAYCARPTGMYQAPVDLLTLGPADMPANSIRVQGEAARKFVTWSYPYKRLDQRTAFVSCAAQDQFSQRAEITNGQRQKKLFDCGQGLAGSFFDAIDHGDPSKVMTQVVRPNTNLEVHYVRVCRAVMHEWPYLSERPASAQVDLGLAYEFGWASGKDRDYAEAAKWYRKAADQGDAKGQSQLASLYDHGQGVQRDFVEAAKWYRLAADQGDGNALLSLGIMYYSGNGVAKDYVQAYKWFMLALARFRASDGIEAMQHDNSVQWRDKVAAAMTPAQIADAQRQAAEWRPARGGK